MQILQELSSAVRAAVPYCHTEVDPTIRRTDLIGIGIDNIA